MPPARREKGRILPDDESWQAVAELSQFDLDLALARLRALREDIEDELRAVDHLQVGRFRQRAHLGRLQLAVEDDQVGAELHGAHEKLLELAASEHGAWIDLGAALNDAIEHGDVGRGRQLAQLGHGLFGFR